MLWRGNDLGLFVVGTVQLGVPYGIANVLGKPAYADARSLIDCALAGGVIAFDTAQAYGDSETVLGEVLGEMSVADDVLLMTKAHMGVFATEAESLEALEGSLGRLKVRRVFALLDHGFSPLPSAQDRVQKTFRFLKAEGLVACTGVSVYSGREALSALALSEVDIVQMPLNVFDRQAVVEGVIDRARSLDKLLIFRSVYLQGLLTMSACQLSGQMSFASDAVAAWQQLCAQAGLSQSFAALQIARRLADGFPLVIGAESAAQVKDNIACMHQALPDLDRLIELTKPLWQTADERLRNPALWGAAKPAVGAGRAQAGRED